MFAMLQASQLPLIANRDYSDCDEIELLDTQRANVYVAISHVWSHGLGNPEGNSLPKCQLNRLSKTVGNLYPNELGPVPYWVDTFCVPTNPSEARSLAILNLRKTYRSADKVLVLDAYLEKVDSSNLFVPEIALYIICSTWLTRLWTLQEGALAQSLYFQFADRIIDLGFIEHSLRYDKSSEEFSSLLGALINYRHAHYQGMNIPASGLIQFLHLAVRNRSTSYATDEALCLATLAGLKMEDIARFTGEEDRMYHFWRMLKPTSSMMAFWTGPRLKMLGRRWAPATLRGNLNLKLDQRKALEEERIDKETVVTERGMMLHAPGLLIDQQDDVSLETSLLIASASENKWYIVRKAGLLYEPLSASEAQHLDIRQRNSARIAIILKRGKRLGIAEYDETAFDDHAVLVRIEEGLPGLVLYAVVICNVSVDVIEVSGLPDPQHLSRAALVPPSTSIDSEIAHDSEISAVAAETLLDDQQWCLG